MRGSKRYCAAFNQTQRLLRAELSDTLTGLRELNIYQARNQQLTKCDQLSEQYNQQLFIRHKTLGNADGLSLLIVQLAMLASIITIVPLVQQPFIPSNDEYTYSSGTALETPVGVMQGHYKMLDEKGQEFITEIEPFRLAVPNVLN